MTQRSSSPWLRSPWKSDRIRSIDVPGMLKGKVSTVLVRLKCVLHRQLINAFLELVILRSTYVDGLDG